MVALDDTLAQQVRRDWRTAPLSTADRVMLGYVEMVTRDPREVQATTLDDLRSAGFDDRAILQITMIAAWFNYINRMADALGVGRET
jgi:uncharacterized peroxidase-related enzyme